MIKLENLSLKMTKTEVEEKFTDYFDNWVCQLEAFLQLLLGASEENSTNNTDTDIAKKWDNEALVAQLTSHHKDYYTAKWAAAHEDVLAFFAPVWLSPLENSCLWITGWKPSMVFRLVESVRLTRLPGGSLAGMTDSQLEKVEELRGKIRLEEEKVEMEMERQQVAMADRRMVELARLSSRVIGRGGSGGDGGDEVTVAATTAAQIDGLVQAVLKNLLVGLERVMKMADCVRLKTLKGLLEVLSPMQCVDFLAAKSMVQIQLRKWGKKRDNDRRNNVEIRENSQECLGEVSAYIDEHCAGLAGPSRETCCDSIFFLTSPTRNTRIG